MSDLAFHQKSPDGAGVVTDASGVTWAIALGGNPLEDAWSERERLHALLSVGEEANRIIVWSGTPADQLFGPDPTIWRPEHRERFNAFIDDALARMSDGVELLIRPHARHIVSDIPSVRTLAAEREGAPLGVLLDPSSMLEPSMLDTVRDHVERIAQGALPAARAVLHAGVRQQQSLGAELAACPMDQSELDPGIFEAFAQQCQRPVIALV